MTDTVRLLNLKYIQTVLSGLVLANAVDAQPPISNASQGFELVALGPLGDLDDRRRYAAGIVPGDEVKTTRFPITDCMLPVVIEFRMTWNTGDAEPGNEAERILGLIQKALLQDITLGGNAYDLREIGNQITLDLWTDKIIVGAIHYEMQYRHHTQDPTQLV
jgi:hypothetical protein